MPRSTSSPRYARICLYCCLCVFAHPVSKILSFDVCQELKKFHVNTLVRVCDATYDKAPVEKEGIQVVVRVNTQMHICSNLSYCIFILSDVRHLASFVTSRTGLLMTVPLLPLRLWTIGSSCLTPSFERNLVAALLCTVWQGLAGGCLAALFSLEATLAVWIVVQFGLKSLLLLS